MDKKFITLQKCFPVLHLTVNDEGNRIHDHSQLRVGTLKFLLTASNF